MKLSIYRFLTSGAKNTKKQHRLIEFGVNQLTSRWAINAWQVTVSPQLVLDQEGISLDRE